MTDNNSTPPQVVSVEEFNELKARVENLEAQVGKLETDDSATQALEAKILNMLKHMGADVRQFKA